MERLKDSIIYVLESIPLEKWKPLLSGWETKIKDLTINLYDFPAHQPYIQIGKIVFSGTKINILKEKLASFDEDCVAKCVAKNNIEEIQAIYDKLCKPEISPA